MRRLAVLRHAKSSWDDPGLDDFARPLNPRGWKAARRMGSELKKRGKKFDLVLASSAARVRETIDGVQEKYDFGAPIRFDSELYGADCAALLALVRALPDSVRAPLLVGHNPGLERLLVEITGDDASGLRRSVARKYPTGAFALVELAADHWADVAPGEGRMVELILPKELD